jgi:1-deoxy-D-xylulose-5-phosphate reductoisomerase
MTVKKNIAILGSTGSIGTQTLDVVRANPDAFAVEVLTGNGNADLLIKQAIEFDPNTVVVADESKYKYVKDALASHNIKVFGGNKAITDVVQMDNIDIVLAAIVGLPDWNLLCRQSMRGNKLHWQTKKHWLLQAIL